MVPMASAMIDAQAWRADAEPKNREILGWVIVFFMDMGGGMKMGEE